MTTRASTLIDELLAARRISTVEAAVLTSALQTADQPVDWVVPSDFAAEALKLWIETACDRLDISPSRLARRAGITPSTLTRFMADDTGRNLGAETIRFIIDAIRAFRSAEVVP